MDFDDPADGITFGQIRGDLIGECLLHSGANSFPTQFFAD